MASAVRPVLVLLEERDVRVAVERVEHGVGVRALHLRDDGGEVGVAQRGVLLALDLHAVRRRVRLDDLVGGLREDVVATHQEEALGALLLEVVERRHDLLVRRRARVEDVLRRLQALVLDRVEQQRVVALEDRQHRLARRRGPAAEHRGYAVAADQLLGLLGEHRGLGRAVLGHHGELLAEHATCGVDLVGRHLQRVVDRVLADRHRAGTRVQEPDLDRRSRGVDARRRGRGGTAGARRVDPRPAGREREAQGQEHGRDGRSSHARCGHARCLPVRSTGVRRGRVPGCLRAVQY